MTDLLNKVTQGDCLDVMKDIPDKSVDMILADLPYGTTACKWDSIIPFEPLWEQYERVIKDNGAIVLTASQPFTSALVMSNPKLFKYEVIWEKTSITNPFMAKKQILKKHESVLIFYKKQPTYNPQLTPRDPKNKRTRSKANYSHNGVFGEAVMTPGDSTRDYNLPHSVLKFSRDVGNQHTKKRTFHPTQKPVSMFEYFIRTFTDEGEVVLDNVIGSGTTAVAAINTGRQFIGIEQEVEYVEIANNRISETLTEKQSVGYGESKCDCRTINRCVDGKCKYK